MEVKQRLLDLAAKQYGIHDGVRGGHDVRVVLDHDDRNGATAPPSSPILSQEIGRARRSVACTGCLAPRAGDRVVSEHSRWIRSHASTLAYGLQWQMLQPRSLLIAHS
jgi:hypothetical protein